MLKKRRYPSLRTNLIYNLVLLPVLVLLFLLVRSEPDSGAIYVLFLIVIFLLIPIEYFSSTYIDFEKNRVFVRPYGLASLLRMFNRQYFQITDVARVRNNGKRTFTDIFGFGNKNSKYVVETVDGVKNLPGYRETDAKAFAEALGVSYEESI